jgi:hypothetical protein
MATEQRKHRWSVWVVIFLAIMLIGYPLSVGPLAMIDKATGDAEDFRSAIDWYYVPLRKLPPPLRGLLARWIHLWRNEEPRQ